MKKFFILCSILSIFLSVSLLFSCEQRMFCCEEQHSQSAQYSTCSPHIESVYDIKTTIASFDFRPTLIGQIFFGPINIEGKNIILRLDRPPAAIS